MNKEFMTLLKSLDEKSLNETASEPITISIEEARMILDQFKFRGISKGVQLSEDTSPDRYAIWWTNQDDAAWIYKTTLSSQWSRLPLYIQTEFTSRLGRAGRGRLWINNDEFPNITGLSNWDTTTEAARWIAKSSHAGIWLHRTDARWVLAEAGFVTDLDLNMIGDE